MFIERTHILLPRLLLLVLAVMLTLSVSCVTQVPTYTDVTPEEAYEMINQQEVMVLDVRTQEEYDSGHIPDALLIPLSELESRLGELNEADHTLVYCASGRRSAKAANLLVTNGFIHVYNVMGEIIQWQAQAFPVI